ncbi:Microcystin-dependent protein [Chitinophaga eiseniae]|uniref:Microcystin-dependent protein n=1 Tax=Chitinophaga eiseniae TaxID=634771 RepID=A0A1T4TC40_9BACT|nr:tail fiber protein [Chitinophaga eiseniae]SKA37779.1 Microcystin-dependent protein [Chitinophaga eiseniae]
MVKEYQFIGDIIMAAFLNAPKGYAQCAGQTVSIQQFTALYAIVGNQYGGNGVTTFQLPDLRGRVPIGAGQGLGLNQRTLARPGGEKSVTLTAANLPPHIHTVREDKLSLPAGANNDTHSPVGAFAGTAATGNLYSSTAGTGTTAALQHTLTMDNGTPALPVNNMQPYLAIQFFIALEGFFPSRG